MSQPISAIVSSAATNITSFINISSMNYYLLYDDSRCYDNYTKIIPLLILHNTNLILNSVSNHNSGNNEM